MFRHFFQVFFRNYRKYKFGFCIHLVGLSTGLGCAFLIYLWVSDELHVDRFHLHDKRLFQVMVNERQGDVINTSEGTNGFLGEMLKKDMPEVEYAVSTTPPGWFRKFNVSYAGNTIGAAGNFVGKDYFNVFSYQLLEGHASAVLSDQNSIVISRSLAIRLFKGIEHAVGKTIEWKWASLSRLVTVAGVFKDFPSHSTTHFDFVLSLDAWADIIAPGDHTSAGPVGGPFSTFVVLRNGTDTGVFGAHLARLSDARLTASAARPFLRKYSDGYLFGHYENGVQTGGRIEYVRLFSIIACFILLIACINFTNLSTARVMGRLREVGLKKALGANRRLLILQFLGESVFLSLLSLMVALVLVVAVLPGFNGIAGKHFSWPVVVQHGLPFLLIAVITGMVGGCYPAFYLSGFKPVTALKGKLDLSAGMKELWVRKGLVVLQFSLSLIFIASVIVVYKQIRLVQDKRPGYDKENVVYFEMEGKVSGHLDIFLTGLRGVPGVVRASSMMNSIVLPSFTPLPGVDWDGKNQDGSIRFYQMPVNYDLLETLDIKMVAGRSFSRQFGSDSAGIVLNETAVRLMGLSDPIGKRVRVYGEEKEIIGVARDFHFNSLHEPIRPFLFRLEPASSLLVMVRLERGKEAAALGAIKSFYNRFNPGFSFDYRFLDEDYQGQYASEKLVAALSWYFAGLAIVLSCLGLFGLAAFMAERRVREIGVRKILGASATDIVYLLSASFAKILLLSILIGVPLSYWMARIWLDHYAYRIELNVLFFVGAAMVLLLTAFLAIGMELAKASWAKPLKALRYN